MQLTPMAYLYNVNGLLKAIRSADENNPSVNFTDSAGRVMTYEGNTIKLDGFTLIVEGLLEEYRRIVKDEIFFGKPIPEVFTKSIHLHDLVDNTRNVSPGYCFIDDPRNGLDSHATAYAMWLLSDVTRASAYTYVDAERLIWRPQPSFDLLSSFQKARQILLTLSITSAGPTPRSTETARQLLRNITGSEVRQVMILKNVLCVLSIQDKTSHQYLRNHFTPHCPSYDVSEALIVNLVFFRPFERTLVTLFRGPQAGRRFHLYLWPRFDTKAIVDAVSCPTIHLHVSELICSSVSWGSVRCREVAGRRHPEVSQGGAEGSKVSRRTWSHPFKTR